MIDSLIIVIIPLILSIPPCIAFTWHPHHRNVLSTRLFSVKSPFGFRNFITSLIEKDIAKGLLTRKDVVTRFPPEPGGYLHLGHAKSIYLNHNIAKHFGGRMLFRFDDTNPDKEYEKYYKAVERDLRWLLHDELDANTCAWDGSVRYSSDYFPRFLEAAKYLVAKGHAYVDDLALDHFRSFRGTLTTGGQDSPYRNRSPEENLYLLNEMQCGRFAPGSCVVRAKINNSSPNLVLRDPTLYRIKAQVHPRTGTAWKIYPTYDFSQALSDAWDGVTHSLCTEEFAQHRPLYDWFLEKLLPSGLMNQNIEQIDCVARSDKIHQILLPRQIEFSRLKMSEAAILSKRRIRHYIKSGIVSGWEDDRLLTIQGLRKRGVSSRVLRNFFARIGISKAESLVPMRALEECMREEFDSTSPRAFCIMRPLPVTIVNSSADTEIELNIPAHPHNKTMSIEWPRRLKFSRNLIIDANDFLDTGPGSHAVSDYRGLVKGGMVRLKSAFILRCDTVVRDNNGNVLSLNCSLIEGSGSGKIPSHIEKPKGTIQWISESEATLAFLRSAPALPSSIAEVETVDDSIDSESSVVDDGPSRLQQLEFNKTTPWVYKPMYIERTHALLNAPEGSVIQFERLGYFVKNECLSEINCRPIDCISIVGPRLQDISIFTLVAPLPKRFRLDNASHTESPVQST